MKKIVLFLLFLVVMFGGILRFADISNNPPGLYIDEVSIALNAYDVLHTGKDEHGVAQPLLFAAFGEYKMPIYIYMVTGSMTIFGKNEFAVRFPSAIFGTLTILVFFYLCRELLLPTTKKYTDEVSLVCSLLLAISSWHIHFSRAGFEATVALFFYTLSLLLFLYCRKYKMVWLIFLSGLSLLISLYTYDGYRLLVPLTIAVGIIFSFKDHFIRKWSLITAIAFCVFALPLFLFTVFGGGLVRFSETSAFFPPSYANPLKNFLANIVIFVKNYVSYFSVTFLFRFGDQFNRHQIQNFGLLYVWQLPFLLAGIYVLSKTKSMALKVFLLFLLLAEPIAPALTKPSPHTLRFLYGVIPLSLLTGLGLYHIFMRKKKWVKALFIVTVLFALVEFGYYLHYYYVHYPKDSLYDWGSTCKELALAVNSEHVKGNTIVIDSSVPCVSEYLDFYTPSVHPIYTAEDVVPKTNGRTILVTSPNDQNRNRRPGALVETVYLPNLNHDVFAQLWSL